MGLLLSYSPFAYALRAGNFLFAARLTIPIAAIRRIAEPPPIATPTATNR